MSSPERGGSRNYGYNQAGGTYEDPYYAQYGSRTGSITPVIDEEARYVPTMPLRWYSDLFGLRTYVPGMH